MRENCHKICKIKRKNWSWNSKRYTLNWKRARPN